MLFDTDVLIWALRGNKSAASRIDNEESLFISSISYMELVKGARNKRELNLIRTFLNDLNFQMLPINENISHRAMIYMEEYALQYGLDIADALIAATAIENSICLCSSNIKHYKLIPNIQLSIFKPTIP